MSKHGPILRDKTIRFRMCYSKSLAHCSQEADAWFPRFLFLGDDWGRFEFDVDLMHVLLFPKRIEVSQEDIEGWLKEYEDWGMLFRWSEQGKEYGFWVNNDEHSPFSKTRRNISKLPPPPEKELETYKKRIRDKLSSKPKKGKPNTPF